MFQLFGGWAAFPPLPTGLSHGLSPCPALVSSSLPRSPAPPAHHTPPAVHCLQPPPRSCTGLAAALRDAALQVAGQLLPRGAADVAVLGRLPILAHLAVLHLQKIS